MRTMIRTLLWVAPLMLTACGFDFESQGVLLDRRILAIQAEPPELLLGVSDLSKPVTFHALVADPKGPVEPQAFEWRWCVPTLATKGFYDPVSSRCSESDETPLVEGSALLSSLTFDVFPQDVMSLLEKALGGPGGQSSEAAGSSGALDPNALQGVQGSVLLAAQLKVADDSDRPLYGLKRIALSMPSPNNQPPNRNPQLAGLLFDGTPWEPGAPFALKMKRCAEEEKVETVDIDGEMGTPGVRTTVAVCEHRITPVFDDTQTENYEAATFDRDAAGNVIMDKVKERLRFDWTITNNGTLSSTGTEQPTSEGPKEVDPISVKWREPARLRGSTLQLWVVVRDGRGGESWETRSMELSE